MYLAKYVHILYTMYNSFFLNTVPRAVNVNTIEVLTLNNRDVIIYWKVCGCCAIYYGAYVHLNICDLQYRTQTLIHA